MLTDKELLENAENCVATTTKHTVYQLYQLTVDGSDYTNGILVGHMMAQLEMEKQKNDMEHL